MAAVTNLALIPIPHQPAQRQGGMEGPVEPIQKQPSHQSGGKITRIMHHIISAIVMLRLLFWVAKEVRSCQQPRGILHHQPSSVLARCLSIGPWKKVWVADSLRATPVNNAESNWHMLLMKGENSEILLFCFFCLGWYTQEYLLLDGAGLMWFLFRLSVPETQTCERWSGEAWTQPPLAISLEKQRPNKQREAWCAQVTAQPAVKKHLSPVIFYFFQIIVPPKLLWTLITSEPIHYHGRKLMWVCTRKPPHIPTISPWNVPWSVFTNQDLMLHFPTSRGPLHACYACSFKKVWEEGWQ